MKKGKTKEAPEPEGKARLNLLIPGDLKVWARDYADRHCTTITNIIVSHFVDLREREKGVDVEQI